MYLEFEKWHGCKNDFILLWLVRAELELVVGSLRRMAKNLCSRLGDGIGADGILVVETASKRDFEPVSLTIINSDGSLASNCGNGLRCAALSVLRRFRNEGQTPPEGVTFTVDGRSIDCRFLGKINDHWPFVAVDMPVPILNEANPWHKEFIELSKNVASQVDVPLLSDYGSCGVGNEHGVFFLEAISDDMIKNIGPKFQTFKAGAGINIHLATNVAFDDKSQDRFREEAKARLGEQVSEIYRAVVWERGAGMTQACGSGACAIGALALSSGLNSRDGWLAVDMPGGPLFVKQNDEQEPIVLAGPGQLVFCGHIEI